MLHIIFFYSDTIWNINRDTHLIVYCGGVFVIVDTKKCNVKYDGEVLEYVYNLVERTLSMKCGDREEKFIVYGVEAISYVKRCDKMDMLYRDCLLYTSRCV